MCFQLSIAYPLETMAKKKWKIEKLRNCKKRNPHWCLMPLWRIKNNFCVFHLLCGIVEIIKILKISICWNVECKVILYELNFRKTLELQKNCKKLGTVHKRLHFMALFLAILCLLVVKKLGSKRFCEGRKRFNSHRKCFLYKSWHCQFRSGNGIPQNLLLCANTSFLCQ